jgi:hypothetical protein
MHRRSSSDGKRKDQDNDGAPQRPHGDQNPNVFDDEFALDPDEDDFMPSVSDGFRPVTGGRGEHLNGNQEHHPDEEDEFMPSVSDGFRPMMGGLGESLDGNGQHHNQNEHITPASTISNTDTDTDTKSVQTHSPLAATRNSTAKAPIGRESMPVNRRMLPTPNSRATPPNPRDSINSTSSFATMTRPDSPLGNGPSHPYGMYPQHTMARSLSIATTSTQQQPQSPVAAQPPAHPYALYTQNLVEDTPLMPQVQTAVPLGFPGVSTAVPAGYRRQIGPDGEEQDIVGPDGHTEQLPPYSRYPDQGPTKASMAAEASATPVEGVPNPMTGSNDTLVAHVATAPSSPVSLPSLLASVIAPTSITPARLPQQRPETQTGNTAAPRPATTSESASLLTGSDDTGILNEKSDEPSSMKAPLWRKKKLWGRIPTIWALAIVILLMVFALILGAAIGSTIARKKGGHKNENPNNSTHHFNPVPVNSPSATLFDATLIPTPTDLPSLPAGQFSLPLGFAQESSPGCLTLGNQYAAWSCKMSFAPLMLTVINSGSPMVSLESFFSPDGNIPYGLQPPVAKNISMQLVTDLDYKGYQEAWHFSARYDKLVVLSPEEFAAGSSLRKRQGDKSFRHHFQVQPGDSPWVCYWNDTYIEGYIYVRQNSTAATITGYPTPNPTDPFGPMQLPSSTTGSAPLASITAAPTSGSSKEKREDRPSSPPRLPPYPRIVKIEERRLPNAPQPFCQKMQLLDNGTLAPATNKGRIVVVQLQEQDPTYQEFYGDARPPPGPSPSNGTTQRKKEGFDKRTDPSDACHCQWMFQ